MHELGVVFYVIKDVKQVAAENKVKKINSVTLEIGEVSGVIEEYLVDCWNWARKKEPVLAAAELIVEERKAVTYCEDCGCEYSTVQYAKICPKCGSEHTYLLRGNEFLIKEIEVEDIEETAESAEAEQVKTDPLKAESSEAESLKTESIEAVLESGMQIAEDPKVQGS